MRPNDVNQENKDEVWMTLNGKPNITSKPKYKVGDIVRVKKYHSGTRLVKGYTVNFTEELAVQNSLRVSW